ncbi:hypothetical protein MasN3_26690 [Massilia varians]|uniref:Uncharacterized protein n=1 Tax=Massilia varians TaxID=457921 RepID=A0ABM8C7M1_9BURK|nr:hypothetical protein MasN3_26690 [Massilia varians]
MRLPTLATPARLSSAARIGFFRSAFATAASLDLAVSNEPGGEDAEDDPDHYRQTDHLVCDTEIHVRLPLKRSALPLTETEFRLMASGDHLRQALSSKGIK